MRVYDLIAMNARILAINEWYWIDKPTNAALMTGESAYFERFKK